MCLDLFLEEAPRASILVRDHSVCSTVFDNLESGKKNYWFGIMSGKVLNFGSKNQCELLLMYPELNRN